MRGSRWLIALLIALVVVLAGALALSLFHDGEDSGATGGKSASAGGEPRTVSAAQLAAAAAATPTPIYWLGPRPGSRNELTMTPEASYVRYLGGDAQAGDKRDDFVTVATYAAADGVAEIRRAAGELPGASLEKTNSGAVLLVEPGASKSAHLAFPGISAQVEIFSPRPGDAERLAKSRLLRAVR